MQIGGAQRGSAGRANAHALEEANSSNLSAPRLSSSRPIGGSSDKPEPASQFGGS